MLRMDKLRNTINRFMDGRYGVDELGRFILYAALLLLMISTLVRSYILTLVITVLVVYGLVRTFSRDYTRRREENRRYLDTWDRIREFFQGQSQNVQDREHAYFHCPHCHQLVRVPRGKGHIRIHCPKCGTDFEKRT